MFAIGVGVAYVLFGKVYWINIAVFIALQLITIWVESFGKPVQEVDDYQDSEWSEQAASFALRLGVAPRPVWVSRSEPRDGRAAEASLDRIRVFSPRVDGASQESMAMLLAHEVAHHTAPPFGGKNRRIWLPRVFWRLLAVIAVCALPIWFAAVAVLAVAIGGGMFEAFQSRRVELYCDRVALQLTRDSATAAEYFRYDEPKPDLPELLCHVPRNRRRRLNLRAETIKLGLDQAPFDRPHVERKARG